MEPGSRLLRGWRAFAAMAAAISLVFAVTVFERAPWFGDLTLKQHHYLNGATLKFLRAWHEEGALALRFALLENPSSIELGEGLRARGVYVSYPPGAFVAPHLLAKLTGEEPNAALLSVWNLLNQWVFTLLVALCALVLARRAGWGDRDAALLASAAGAVLLLLPPPMYWFHGVYFADMAVMAPFAALTLVQVLREGAAPRRLRWLGVFEAALLCVGTLIDWFFPVLAVTLCVWRWARAGRPGRAWVGIALRTGLPVAAGLGLFAVQLAFTGGFPVLVEKFLFRTGVSAEGAGWVHNFAGQFWWGHLRRGYGIAGLCLLLAAAVVCVRTLRRQRTGNRDPFAWEAAQLGLWLVGACVLQVQLLRNHSAIHGFSALKFAVPIVLGGGVLAPLLLAREKGWPVRWRHGAMTALLAYGLVQHLGFARQFPPPAPELHATGAFLRAHTSFGDVVFSPDFEIAENPPQWVALSRKRVYRVDSVPALNAALAPLPETARPLLYVRGDPPEAFRTILGGVVARAPGQALYTLDLARR